MPKKQPDMSLDLEPADLDPELVPFVVIKSGGKTMIDHPLLRAFLPHPLLNSVYNKNFRAKKRIVAQAESEGDWATYLLAHERPYRIDVFLKISERLEASEYWSLLGDIFIDTENLRAFGDSLPGLLRDPRPGRVAIMEEQEQAFLNGLPNEVVVYRGHQHKNKLNHSWTLSRSKARWFAHRFGRKGAVIRGVARKEDIHAVFLRRGEHEVLIDPAAVTGIETVRPLQRSAYFKNLLSQARARFRLPEGESFHGPTHWEQVEFFGRALCGLVGDADPQVVQHFTLLHDACRENEDQDPKHGQRAAAWMKRLDLELEKDQKRKLDTAIRLHNDGQTSDDPTIGVCWDADRLDLPRVGITPDASLLSTKAARDNIWKL